MVRSRRKGQYADERKTDRNWINREARTVEELQRRYQEGDLLALELLMLPLNDPFFRRALARLWRDDHLATDALGDTHRRLSQPRVYCAYDPARPFRPYAAAQLEYAIRDNQRTHYRRIQRLTPIDPADLVKHPAPSGPSEPEARADYGRLVMDIEDCLSRMSEDQRIMLRLMIFDELSIGEIADMMPEVPYGTLASRKSRALGRLAECLRRKGYDHYLPGEQS